ncbi:hypothetical protein C7S17_5499 [Burkholderia thailandensis]|nr:hypothetical protein [Burkholderia thailandensis]
MRGGRPRATTASVTLRRDVAMGAYCSPSMRTSQAQNYVWPLRSIA